MQTFRAVWGLHLYRVNPFGKTRRDWRRQRSLDPFEDLFGPDRVGGHDEGLALALEQA